MIGPFNRGMGQTLTTDANKTYVDEGFLAHIQIPAVSATAGSNNAILAATALTAATQAIIQNITNPAIPRNIEIVGNASGIVGDATIKGTNFNGDAISETLTLNGTTVVEGAKAFKTITEIDLPIQTHAGTDTVSVGYGEKLGIPYKLAHNTVLMAFLNNVKEATAPTVVTNASNLENNTFKLNSALNGNAVDLYLIV